MHRPLTTPTRTLACVVLTAVAACQPGGEPPAPESEPVDPAAGLIPAAEAPAECGTGGRLSARLYGALEGEFEWRGDELRCEGMPRPEGRGARLRFSGEAGPGRATLVVIVAIPRLARGATTTELPSNITLIEEGVGRFFSTSDLDHCWTDVSLQEALEPRSDAYRIEGSVYCIAPLPEVNGDSSVTIERLEFTGRIDWSAS